MKVLFIQPTCDRKGHYGIWAVKLCQALAKMGHHVTLCTNKVDPKHYLNEEPLFNIVEVGNGKFSFERFDRNAFWSYFRNTYVITLEALRLSRREKFDVIHIADGEFMTASFILKKYESCLPPVIRLVNVPNFSFNTYPGSTIKKLYKVIQREIFKTTIGKGIKALTVLGEWQREMLRSQLRLKQDFPIVVIPDGGGEPVEVLNKLEAREKLGINFDGPIFLFFGMLRKDKGIEYLIEALHLLRNEHLKLIIAGDPTEYTESKIQEMVQRAKASEKIILELEYIAEDKVPFYFIACDALILPYSKIYKGLTGIIMKWACTYKKPVIATDVSGMGGLIKQYGIGLVAEPENPSSMAERIREFLSLSEKEQEKMAENASNLAKLNSWTAMAERFTELYEEILQGQKN